MKPRLVPEGALLGLVLLAVIVRFLPLGQVFLDGRAYLFDGDSYLHVRKVLLHCRSFPGFVTHDFYEGYPEGTPALWPPLLDYLFAAVALVVGGGHPTASQVAALLALAPPLVGGATILLLYRFARRVFDRPVGLVAAGMLALMPAHVVFTVVGRSDNEMLEPLLVLSLLLAYLRLQDRGDWRGAGLAAGAALLTLLFWRGATVYVLLVALAAALDVSLDLLGSGVDRKRADRTAGAFLILGVALTAFCLVDPWGNQRTFQFNVVSWFHAFAFLAAAAGLFAFGRMALWWGERGLPRAGFFAALGALGLVAASLGLGVPALRSNLTAGLAMVGLGERNPWIESIQEYQPLFSGPAGFDALGPLEDFGWGLASLAPVLAAIAFARRREPPLDRRVVFFLLGAVCLLVLGVLRTRFMHVLALEVSVAVAWLAVELARSAGRRRAPRTRAGARLALAVMLVAVLFHPVAFVVALPRKHPGFSIRGPIEEAMLWLRRETPAPGDPYRPGEQPDYGVMARWDFAGWIESVAERPAIATLYGTETFGFEEAAEFFLARSEEEANRVLGRVGARYVVAYPVAGSADMYARALGRRAGPYASLEPNPAGGFFYLPALPYYDLVSTNLQMTDGIPLEWGRVSFPPLDRFRLLHESRERMDIRDFPREVKLLKIFERVEGATLVAEGDPGEEVTVGCLLRTNQERVVRFERRARLDSAGTAAFVLPHATRSGPGATGVEGTYTVESAGVRRSLVVSEEDVLEGRRLRVSLR